ncbi:hypothetical protein GLOTRDRAFT_109142 [Gloeophyllum trabeum ATCC 11539]|uniref:Uncharacterized protein n=1 Tax=Gloeophyllum trabeum (strain ATCC 11539 / FP-39264 / Madison 617) TaxID=670483 RepID=S7S4G2_GLOTA|nr:uncharacterized protein GLOTRDRAFT_109142 [Gloeophyllum trabeum ATCC 11539]EPQ60794.1 hypothetical protein GLOTRDRAFT_109142 [Gloeophyllum trabeum ATCC 11539]
MQLPSLLALLFFPLLVLSQNSNNGQVITSLSTGVVIVSGSNGRQEATTTATIIQTLTNAGNNTAQPTGNATQSGNQTSPSQTASGNSSSSTIPYSLLPTAPTSIDGGGGDGGAPSPGASGAGGVYGPDDGYIAAALMANVNVVLVSLAGILVGGALVFA